MVIYKITNLINGKIYIGQTKSVGIRFKCYWGSGKLIRLAIKKYGKENFKKEIIEECNTKEELNIREIFWIKELNTKAPNGYNILKGGSCRHDENAYWSGKTHTEEYKKMCSERSKGEKSPCWHIKYSPERCKQLSDAHIGQIPWNKGKTNIYSDDTIQKMSESAKCRKTTVENEALRRKKISDFNKQAKTQAKPIIDNRDGQIYDTIISFRKKYHLTEYMYKKLLNQKIIELYENKKD
jgi:hypothetical protein